MIQQGEGHGEDGGERDPAILTCFALPRKEAYPGSPAERERKQASNDFSLHSVAPDGLLVPAYADPRRVGDRDLSVLQSQGLLEDGVRPIYVLQPVARRGNRQEVSADLREEVAGERKTCRLRQRGGLEPARNTADLPGVRHRVVGGAGLYAPGHVVRPPPVLARLDRGPGLAPHLRVAGVVIRANRLLYPVEPFAVQDPGAPPGLRDRERLVVVGHQHDVLADRAPDGPD